MGTRGPTWPREGPPCTTNNWPEPRERSGESHSRRSGLPCRQPRFDLRYVAFRIFGELLETSGATERVFALGSLDREPLLALLGDVHDHVADRIEHLSLARHPLQGSRLRAG